MLDEPAAFGCVHSYRNHWVGAGCLYCPCRRSWSRSGAATDYGLRTPPCHRVDDEGLLADEQLSTGCPHSTRQHFDGVGCLHCGCLRSWEAPPRIFVIDSRDLSRLEVIAQQFLTAFAVIDAATSAASKVMGWPVAAEIRRGLLNSSDLVSALAKLRHDGRLPDPISRYVFGIDDLVERRHERTRRVGG